MTQYLNVNYIEKTLNDLIKSIEKLEDKISEIEDRIERHIHTYDDLAHKI